VISGVMIKQIYVNVYYAVSVEIILKKCEHYYIRSFPVL